MSAKDWWIEERHWEVKRKYGKHPAISIPMLSWNRPLRTSDFAKAHAELRNAGTSPEFTIFSPKLLQELIDDIEKGAI